MPNSNRKGAKRERELVNWLDENGWAVLRAPASGSATERELPDVLFGNGERFVAAEVKSSAGDPIYIDGAEVEALEYFADSFGAEPMLAVKFDLERADDAWGSDRPGFYFIDSRNLYRTDGGNFRVKKDLAVGAGTKEVDL